MTTEPTGGRPPGGRVDGTSATRPPPLPGAAQAQQMRQAVAGIAPARRFGGLGKAAKLRLPRLGFLRLNIPALSGRRAAPRRKRSLMAAGQAGAFRERAHQTGKIVLYTVIPLVMLAAIAAGVVFVRLRHGPISFDVLVPPIERGINAELVNNQVSIGGAELRFGRDGGLEFRLRDMSVLDHSGTIVASAPLSAVNISTAALWRLRVVPERVILIDPEINLIFNEETGLALSTPKSQPKNKDDAAAGKPQGSLSGNDAKPPPAAPDSKASQPLNFAKMLSQASARARKRLDATSYLTEIGFENATVVLDYAGRRSSWRIEEFGIDFNHRKKRSVISGRARVASPRGAWALSFLTDENEKTDRIEVKANIRDLVPSTLAAAAPPLALLGMFEVPVAGDATVEIETDGDIVGSEIALQVGSGRLVLPGVNSDPFELTAGLFRLTYDGKERSFQLQPSPVKWADGNIMFSGSAKDISGEHGPPVWRYTLDGKNGTLEASEFGIPPVTLDQWSVLGAIIPRRGVVEVGDFRVRGGGGEVVVKAMARAGPEGQSARADVTISPMPLATVKALWPRALASGAREWIGKRVTDANFKGGSVRFTSGEFLEGEAPSVGAAGERLSATFEVADATAVPLDGMVPITAPRALVRLENNALEVAVPDATAVLPQNRKVALKGGRLTAPDVIAPQPEGELTFSVQSSLAPFFEALESLPVRPVREAAPFPKAAEGKVDAQVKIKLPLISELKVEQVGIEGKAKITDGRFGKVAGQFDVQGFTLALDLTVNGLDAKGDLLVNGVPAKIAAARNFAAGNDEQPPLTITATLDDADRNQLGLDINDLVRGAVPVEVTLQKGPARPEPLIKLKADLTNTELMIDAIAWKKVAGRHAVLDADIAPGKTYKTELQNFKLAGDDIAVEGWAGIGADNKLKEFFFPEFTLNLVSRLELQGVRGNDAIWNVKAHGKTFDGRDFFRSLFSVEPGQKAKGQKPAAGIDLSADIDNVIGASELTMKGLKVKLSSRAEKLTTLDARGTLEGGSPIAVVLDTSTGMRRLRAQSNDAGQMLKFVGFYPNIQNGQLKLEINLDGKGAADKTGTLWVENFRVLGDPIVSEVVGSAEQSRPPGGGQGKVTREVFSFDNLRAPFSVGYGQFVLEDASVRGQAMGASLTGKVDFKTRKINLGGTYIPVQGLNNVLGGIPVLGQLISGSKTEGIFGITFAIQGGLDNPQVVVNPLSMVAPGIFRDIFQMTNPNQKVQAREDKGSATPVEERTRASAPPVAPPVITGPPPSAQAARGSGKGGGQGQRNIGEEWTSTTSQPGPN